MINFEGEKAWWFISGLAAGGLWAIICLIFTLWRYC